MAEHDRLTLAPILVKDIDLIFCGDDRHVLLPMVCSQMLERQRMLYVRLYVFLMMRRFLIKLVKVMDRTVAVSDTKTVGGFDRRRDPCLRAAHRLLQRFALSKTSRNRRRQRTAGAVGVLCR